MRKTEDLKGRTIVKILATETKDETGVQIEMELIGEYEETIEAVLEIQKMINKFVTNVVPSELIDILKRAEDIDNADQPTGLAH